MVIFLTIFIVSGFSALAVFQLISNSKMRTGGITSKQKYSPYTVLLTALLLLCNLVPEGHAVHRIPVCLLLGLLAYQSAHVKKRILICFFQALCGLYFIADTASIFVITSLNVCLLIYFILLAIYVLSYVRDFFLRIKLVRNVMKIGSVWESLCLQVDALYMIFLLALSALYPFLIHFLRQMPAAASIAFSVLLSLYIMALIIRNINSSVFILWTEHERHIVESMKVSHLEVVGDCQGYEQLYETIYERILDYFEKQKPYLDSELSINNIVENVYSNKVYISRSISQHTGRNFCQFVNYYRVLHAVELFRENPKLKVVEMASRSGFNSSVSFSAAFRLFMGEKPGDWCRKERVLLEKHKKFVAQ